MKHLPFLLSTLLITGCLSLDPTGGGLATGDSNAQAIRDALAQGARIGTERTAREDGYWGNELIRIALPPDVQRVERTLRQVGMGREVDRALLAINRAAEQAAGEALPIFAQAIRQMTITDALGIIRGDANAATAYLRRTTENHLLERFQPIIADALQQTGATRLYGEVATAYNLIASADRTIDPELDRYVTGQAIAGLFTLIAEEEARIRADPLARTTAAMRQAFR